MLVIQSKAAQSYSDYMTALEVTAAKLMQQLIELKEQKLQQLIELLHFYTYNGVNFITEISNY